MSNQHIFPYHFCAPHVQGVTGFYSLYSSLQTSIQKREIANEI